MNKPAIGQTVYVKLINGSARRSGEITEAVVTKVGRRHFETDQPHYGKFFVDNLYQDSGRQTAYYRCYLSRQDIEDEREMVELYKNIKQWFDCYSPTTLEQLRRIRDIIQEGGTVSKDKESAEFVQGYVCAVTCLIQLNGGVDVRTKEVFEAGIGGKSLSALKECGVDEYDLGILKEHWRDLTHDRILR